MTLLVFRGAKSHEWTFCDPINSREQNNNVIILHEIDYWVGCLRELQKLLL